MARPGKPVNESLRPGFRLSRYTILRRLSAGGFGVVYVARREDGRLVALKEFLPASLAVRTAADEGRVRAATPAAARKLREGLEAFFREADTLARIHDDQVIAVWDVFEANGTAYFAMPVEKGITLQAAIRGAPAALSGEFVREVFIRACRGVEVLHAHGLLHLDIKPSNLWLRPDGTVVVLDLGASRWEDEEGRTSHLARTPGFAAPEQHGSVKVKDLTVRTDVYGLAASLWAALEGAPPPPAPQRRSAKSGLLAARVGQHHPALLALVDKGMALDPAHRFASVAGLRHALERVPRHWTGIDSRHRAACPTLPADGLGPGVDIVLPPGALPGHRLVAHGVHP